MVSPNQRIRDLQADLDRQRSLARGYLSERDEERKSNARLEKDNKELKKKVEAAKRALK